MSCLAAWTIFCLASDRFPMPAPPFLLYTRYAGIHSKYGLSARPGRLGQLSLNRPRKGFVMPFGNISLARGKPGESLEAVSQAVHDALVAELHMKPEDEFQLIHQHEPGEMVFNRNFRGGPRSDDWIVFTITDGLERGERAKRRFYKTLVRLLEEGPGVRPADVFVMMTVTPPENFSFADGVTGTDVAAAEALDAAAKDPGSRETYTKAEMAYAITELLGHRDSRRILPMLRQDFVLKIPVKLPYGGGG